MTAYAQRQSYLVRPFDVCFFRDNRAFDLGEWYSEGIFPPLPSTFQGFVRTCILHKKNLIQPNGTIDWAQAGNLIGDDGTFPFNLIGPFIYSSEAQWLFLPPRDAVVRDGKEVYQIQLSDEPMKTDIGNLHYALDSPKSFYLSYADDFITSDSFNDYRRYGKFCPRSPKAVEKENHYGIKLEYRDTIRNRETKKAHDHHFYLTPYHRLHEHAAFYFNLHHNITDLDLAGQSGRLGSESRGAIINTFDKNLSLKLEDGFYNELAQERRLKIILLQPGIFPEDWLPFQKEPSEDNKEVILVKYKDLSLQLLYAQTGHYHKISGLNFKAPTNNGTPSRVEYSLKKMVHGVPAGSVYYFKILEDSLSNEEVAASLKDLDDSKIEHAEYSKMGYNHVVLGKII
jgi:CRISPR-associated protein Cmr3